METGPGFQRPWSGIDSGCGYTFNTVLIECFPRGAAETALTGVYVSSVGRTYSRGEARRKMVRELALAIGPFGF